MSRTPLHVLAKDRALRLAKDMALRFRASRALFLAKNASFPAAKHTKHTFRASPLPRAWLQHGSMDQPCAPDSKPPRTVPILLPDIQPEHPTRPISWISGKQNGQNGQKPGRISNQNALQDPFRGYPANAKGSGRTPADSSNDTAPTARQQRHCTNGTAAMAVQQRHLLRAACVSHRQAVRRSKRKMDVADTQRFTQIFCGVLPQKILTTR